MSIAPNDPRLTNTSSQKKSSSKPAVSNVPSSAPLPTTDYLAKARERFPQWSYLLDNPDVGPLLKRAIDDPAYSSERLQADIMATNWWKFTQTSAREWESLQYLDPEEAANRQRQKQQDIWDLSHQYGLDLDGSTVEVLAKQALQLGWRDEEIQNALVMRFQYQPGRTPIGDFGLAMNQIKDLARQWYVPVDDKTAYDYAWKVMAGEQQVEDYGVMFRDQAKGRFPTLAPQIDSGISPDQFFRPYQQQIAQTLAITPDQIDLMDTQWSQVISMYDQQAKTQRPMTLNEAQQFARSKPQWRKTQNSQQSAAAMVEQLSKTLGATA